MNTHKRINDRCINDRIKIPSIIDMQKNMGEIKTIWTGEHIEGEEETRWERRRATTDTGESCRYKVAAREQFGNE
jgi:hypothetical protein